MISHVNFSLQLNTPFGGKKALLAFLVSATPSISLASSVAEETFVTATRIEQPLENIIGSVSVITENDIQIIKPFDLNDLLELEAGVDMVRSGGRGSQSSLLIRGASSAQSLILLNGQRIASVSSGTSNYTLIPPEMLSKVELVKGATSAIYGSDAIGAVVNAITYRAQDHDGGIRIGIDYGSHAYHRDAIAGNIKQGEVFMSLAVYRENSDGIDNTVDYEGKIADADADGYKKVGGAISFDYVPDSDTRLSFLSISNTSESDYDANYAGSNSLPYSDASLDLNQIAVVKRINSNYKTEIALSQSRDESESRDHLVEPWPSFYSTKNTNGSWINQIDFAGQTFVVGYDFTQSTIDSADQFMNSSEVIIEGKESEAGFVSFNGVASFLKYQLGVRVDDLKELGLQQTQNAGLAFDVFDGQKVYGKYGEAFRAPTLNDLYSPWGGNDQLQPEESEQFEIGYKFTGIRLAFQVAIYQNNVVNLIEWRPISDFAWAPKNIGEAVLEGAELTLSYRHSSLGDLAINVDYLHAIDDLTDTPLHYRPSRNASMTWAKLIHRLTLGAQVKFQSERSEPAANEGNQHVVNAGYGLLNLSSDYKINDFLSVNFKLNNVLDKEFHLKSDYREDGRNVTLGLRANF